MGVHPVPPQRREPRAGGGADARSARGGRGAMRPSSIDQEGGRVAAPGPAALATAPARRRLRPPRANRSREKLALCRLGARTDRCGARGTWASDVDCVAVPRRSRPPRGTGVIGDRAYADAPAPRRAANAALAAHGLPRRRASAPVIKLRPQPRLRGCRRSHAFARPRRGDAGGARRQGATSRLRSRIGQYNTHWRMEPRTVILHRLRTRQASATQSERMIRLKGDTAG